MKLTGTTTGTLSKGTYTNPKGDWIFKGNSSVNAKEPLSEYFASRIFSLFTDSVKYDLVNKDSQTEDIVTYGYPFVSVCRRVNGDIYQLYNACRAVLNLPTPSAKQTVDFIKEMGLSSEHLLTVLLVDALIGNRDRHWNNIDVIVKNGKMEWTTVLDFGQSLLFNIPDDKLEFYDYPNIGPDSSHPFSDTHNQNIHYAAKLLDCDTSILSHVRLDDITELVYEAYKKLPEGACSKKRIMSILSYLTARYKVYIEPNIRKSKGRFSAK